MISIGVAREACQVSGDVGTVMTSPRGCITNHPAEDADELPPRGGGGGRGPLGGGVPPGTVQASGRHPCHKLATCTIIHGDQRPDQITRTVQRFHHATTNTNSPDMQDRRGNSRGRPDGWLSPLTPIDNDIFLGGMDHLWTLASIISRTSYQRAS